MITPEDNELLTRVGPEMGQLLRRYWHPIAGTIEMTHRPTKAVQHAAMRYVPDLVMQDQRHARNEALARLPMRFSGLTLSGGGGSARLEIAVRRCAVPSVGKVGGRTDVRRIHR